MNASIGNFALAIAIALVSFGLIWVSELIIKQLKGGPLFRGKLGLYAMLIPVLILALALFYKAGSMLASGGLH